MQKQRIVVILIITVLLASSFFSFYSLVSERSKGLSEPAAVSSAQTPEWLFNGSYANYTGFINGAVNHCNFSISGFNSSSGNFSVTIHSVLSHSPTIMTNESGNTIFPGINASTLSYLYAGKTPPWINSTAPFHYNNFSVSPGNVASTSLGNYTSDQIVYQYYTVVNHFCVNGTTTYDASSGLALKYSQSVHLKNQWVNISYSLSKTNIPLGQKAAPPAIAPLEYYAGAIGMAAIAAICTGIILLKKKK